MRTTLDMKVVVEMTPTQVRNIRKLTGPFLRGVVADLRALGTTPLKSQCEVRKPYLNEVQYLPRKKHLDRAAVLQEVRENRSRQGQFIWADDHRPHRVSCGSFASKKNRTFDYSKVTCKNCLRLIQQRRDQLAVRIA